MIGFWTYCGFSHQRSPPPCWQFMRKKIGGSDIFMQSFFGSISSHQMVLRYCTVYFLLLCNRFIWQQKSSYPPFYKYYITIYTSAISIKRNKTFTYMFLQDVENFKHNFFLFLSQPEVKLHEILFKVKSTCLLIKYIFLKKYVESVENCYFYSC